MVASTASQRTTLHTTNASSTTTTLIPAKQLATSLSNILIDLMTKGGVEAYETGSSPPLCFLPIALSWKRSPSIRLKTVMVTAVYDVWPCLLFRKLRLRIS